MAGSKSRMPSERLVERWIRAGYGQGEGSQYKPFLYVRDVPSRGTSSMVKSRITDRTHHYLSKQELKVHLLSTYQPNVVDIREQFALLPRSETAEISENIGIRHPVYPGTNTPTVMTTDLLITIEQNSDQKLLAISAKLSKDLSDRNIEKLRIEQLYWERRGVKWILATEKNIPAYLSKNLEFFENTLHDERVTECSITPTEFSMEFERNHCATLCFNQILSLTSRRMNLDASTGFSLLGVAVWAQISRIDLNKDYITHRAFVNLQDQRVRRHEFI